MTCTIENLGCMPEGATSYHDYIFTDKNGDPITSVDKIEYKLTDGIGTLIDWTEITPPDAPGELEILAIHNIISGSAKRFLSIKATYNSDKVAQKTIIYDLSNSLNVEKA